MIFGFTFISKKGKGKLYRKKTTGFTLIVIRETKDLYRKGAGKRGDGSPLFIIYRSQYFTTTTIEIATTIYLSRPEELLI
jgi:hypothetical protein